MGVIDETLIALGAYVIFSAILSYSLSVSESKRAEVPPVLVQVKKEPEPAQAKKGKKDRLIPSGSQALCLVCDRYFENDTYLKNHLEGQKHVKKALGFKGSEIYKIMKVAEKKS